ncbi:MAG: cyanophycin synthetase, partial [Sphingobacteriales bacterium]
RGYGHEKELTQISIDKDTRQILEKRGLTLESVIPDGEELYLKTTANLSTGGTSTDVTEYVHPYNIFMAERIARIIGLDICGIDVMTTDLGQHVSETGGAVIEVNAAPGFRMHIAPTIGLPRNVAEPVIDMLYPPGCSARIPILAVTGTNGKTTTTRLLAHIMRTNGSKVGFTTTDGVYIQNRMVQKGDCTGPVSTELVLRDPTIDMAVLEVARGGILRAGLGFHNCDIGVVTNISADHLGLKDIHTVEEMAKVKAVVVESVLKTGYAVLNADDDLVYKMRIGLDCNVALFSLDENSDRINRHCKAGGIAAVVENGYVSIRKGSWNLRINRVHSIPLTLNGRATFNVQNLLAASLAAYLHGVK